MTVIYNMSIDRADKPWIGDRRFTEVESERAIAAAEDHPLARAAVCRMAPLLLLLLLLPSPQQALGQPLRCRFTYTVRLRWSAHFFARAP